MNSAKPQGYVSQLPLSPVLFHPHWSRYSLNGTSCTNGCKCLLLSVSMSFLWFSLLLPLLICPCDFARPTGNWHMRHTVENACTIGFIHWCLSPTSWAMPRLAFCRLNRTEIRVRLPQSSPSLRQ